MVRMEVNYTRGAITHPSPTNRFRCRTKHHSLVTPFSDKVGAHMFSFSHTRSDANATSFKKQKLQGTVGRETKFNVE